jgi:hypothetical protein
MRRARIIALIAVPVLLLGAGCRGGAGAGGGPDGGSSGGGSGGGDGSVEQQFDDVESTLSSIESELAENG